MRSENYDEGDRSELIIAELRERLADVHEWICQLRQNEVQALHDKVELLKNKQSMQTFASRGVNSARGASSTVSRRTAKHQQTLGTKESQPSARSYKPAIDKQNFNQTEPEPYFTFNCTPAQQKLLHEEVSILREQISQTMTAY